MNLKYLNTSDRQLDAMSHGYGAEGAAVRKEIIRRKSIGYWDGSLKTKTHGMPEFEEATIMAKPMVLPTARKVEKKIAGRGR